VRENNCFFSESSTSDDHLGEKKYLRLTVCLLWLGCIAVIHNSSMAFEWFDATCAWKSCVHYTVGNWNL